MINCNAEWNSLLGSLKYRGLAFYETDTSIRISLPDAKALAGAAASFSASFLPMLIKRTAEKSTTAQLQP